MLGLNPQHRAAPRPNQPMPQLSGASRFLLPINECKDQLSGILEQLTCDPWPVQNGKRALRCTGNAISVAVGLLEVRVYCCCSDNLFLIMILRLFSPIPAPELWSFLAVHALKALAW